MLTMQGIYSYNKDDDDKDDGWWPDDHQTAGC